MILWKQPTHKTKVKVKRHLSVKDQSSGVISTMAKTGQIVQGDTETRNKSMGVV